MKIGLALWAVVCFGEVEFRDKVTRSFTMPSAAGVFKIDNVHGAVRVTGHAGNEVRIIVNEHWRAESDEKLAEGRKEVRVDMTQKAGEVSIYVDGPFRCGEGNISFRGDAGYRFRHEFEIVLPEGMNFEVRNINGPVSLTGMAGSGSAHTVNGKLAASFVKSPANASSFKTVNGAIETEFPPQFNADLRFRTMNGNAYTDFEGSPLPGAPVEATKVGTKYVYRTSRMLGGIRVGTGGPEIRFETLNGAIRVQKRGSDR